MARARGVSQRTWTGSRKSLRQCPLRDFMRLWRATPQAPEICTSLMGCLLERTISLWLQRNSSNQTQTALERTMLLMMCLHLLPWSYRTPKPQVTVWRQTRALSCVLRSCPEPISTLSSNKSNQSFLVTTFSLSSTFSPATRQTTKARFRKYPNDIQVLLVLLV